MNCTCIGLTWPVLHPVYTPKDYLQLVLVMQTGFPSAFTPHLSVGQFTTIAECMKVSAELQAIYLPVHDLLPGRSRLAGAARGCAIRDRTEDLSLAVHFLAWVNKPVSGVSLSNHLRISVHSWSLTSLICQLKYPNITGHLVQDPASLRLSSHSWLAEFLRSLSESVP